MNKFSPGSVVLVNPEAISSSWPWTYTIYINDIYFKNEKERYFTCAEAKTRMLNLVNELNGD